MVDFRAEAEDSESSRRVSWARRAERWGVRASVHLDGCSRWGHQTYSLENVFQLGFGARLFFGGFGGDVGHGGILGVAVEEGVCLGLLERVAVGVLAGVEQRGGG